MNDNQKNILIFTYYLIGAFLLSLLIINVARLFLLEKECGVDIVLQPAKIENENQICYSSNEISFIIESKNNFQIDKIRLKAIDNNGKILIRDIENSIAPAGTLQDAIHIEGYSEIKSIEFIPFIITRDKIKTCSTQSLIVDNPKKCSFLTLPKS